jgi:hypothetical protein
VLERLGVYLREQKDGALPKSQYGQAIGYVLNPWDELRRFTEDGHLEIDNNTAERTLRLCAISRNYAQLPIMRRECSLTIRNAGIAAIRPASLFESVGIIWPGFQAAHTTYFGAPRPALLDRSTVVLLQLPTISGGPAREWSSPGHARSASVPVGTEGIMRSGTQTRQHRKAWSGTGSA